MQEVVESHGSVAIPKTAKKKKEELNALLPVTVDPEVHVSVELKGTSITIPIPFAPLKTFLKGLGLVNRTALELGQWCFVVDVTKGKEEKARR